MTSPPNAPHVGTLVAALATLAILMGIAGGAQRLREERYPALAGPEDSLDITSGAALKRMTAGYNALAADLYWIRTIQYYGDVKLRLADASPGRTADPAARADYRLLYPLLNLTTTLDPRFNIAYRFGAIFLAEGPPGGPGRPDLAIALLQKGLSAQPDKWEYMQDIGFVHYWWVHDYQAAAGWFNRAADVPGAPWWLRSLAATTLAAGGDRQSSRVMWEAIRQSAEVDWQRRDAERRLIQLNALDQIDGLQKKIDAYARATGEAPANWSTLVRARVFPGVPIDPTGAPYDIDRAGRVHVSMKSPLFPLPDEASHIGTPPS